MTGLAKDRLKGLGYEASDEDNALLEFCRQSVEERIRNICNIPEGDDIPRDLSCVVIDRVCGEFLFVKRMSGQLKLGELDISSAAVKQIVEGDVSVSFYDNSSDGERLDGLIDRLMSRGEKELVRFRRIRWFK